MTDRQRAALEFAAAAGYYETPKGLRRRHVATELECAHSTAGELLRKAEAAVVTAFVDSRGAWRLG